MHKLLFLFSGIIISSFLSACNTSVPQENSTYNLETQKEEHQKGTAVFQLRTEILPKKIALSLVSFLTNETIPGTYTIKRVTRRLLPNDYMAQANTTLYLENLTNQTINFNLLALSIEHKRLPYSVRKLTLSENEALSIPLGEVDVDFRLNTLNTRIEYIADGIDTKWEHKEKQFDMLRIIQHVDEEKDKENKTQEVKEDEDTSNK